ncbi:MAG: NUDIX hydrolase [Limnochordia bacterium]|nr:NUDIX hydrolase [Limnochordia bacterium]MDI9464172.1 NUDIX hydrolase [Bacillota bacterium]NLO95726.1 NUDIX hydrolase [Bacillota bacterium]HAN95390.1 ADP-ribose pyrophosphatase [Bacillota bacterium]HOB41038.1 NUDIX hydrolase [Limnochordia bacterium]
MFRFTTKDVWIGSRVRQFKMVDHPGAAATLVVKDGQVLLVEQYRPAAGRKMLEIPAGTIDRSEPPLECARRELQEETGYSAEDWESLGHIYPTPGYTNEVLHLFYASGLTKGEQHLDPGEDINVRWIPLEKVEEMIDQGEINDAKTIIAVFKYLRNLRKQG